MKKYRTRSNGSFGATLLLLAGNVPLGFLGAALAVSLGKLQNSLYKYKKI